MNGVTRTAAVPLEIDTERGQGALRVDLSIFAVDAVLRASYALTGRCHVFVDRGEQETGYFTVTVRTRGAGGDVDELLGDLSNELIDQQIRERLSERTGAIRELIVAQAFAEGNLLDPDRDDVDPEDDPHGIGRLRGKTPNR